ncbi:hypothetical protein BH20CHL7_BH20CHL7_07590 [soil metagenome]
MSMSSRRSDGPRSGDSGQIIVLFALSMVAILAMAALLFSGAHSLVVRRQLQDAGDAAALVAANILQAPTRPKGCSDTGAGDPQQYVKNAVTASLEMNLPGFPAADVVVTCPTGWENNAVRVSLKRMAPSFFGSSGIQVATTSNAVNGQIGGSKYSVVMLDPANSSWGSSYNGCPSFLIGGGITATFEGSIMVNSNCKVAGSQKGAMDANGGSATLTLTNQAQIKLAGEYNKQTLTIYGSTPAENVTPILADPLAGLTDPLTYIAGAKASLPTYTQANVCKGTNNNPCTMQPGIYDGGINTSGGQVIFLRPGVYVMNGGGFNLGPSSVYSIPSDKTTTSLATWDADCPLGSTKCGVIIYNATKTGSWTLNKDYIGMGANTVLRLRAYNHLADVTANKTVFSEYDNVLFWQARTPAPGSGKPQPTVSLGGGGNVVLSGTVYAPGAQVKFGGGGSGSGGADEDVSIQFICWDLQLQGSSKFTFRYRSNLFARPTSYGLVE